MPLPIALEQLSRLLWQLSLLPKKLITALLVIVKLQRRLNLVYKAEVRTT